jgi:hypothetical protein
MSRSLSELLKLSAAERAELAMALWESLSEAQREAEFELTADEARTGPSLERSPERPESAIPWKDVRRKLMDRE